MTDLSNKSHKLKVFTCTAGTNDNDVIVTVSLEDASSYDTWILGSSAGAMDVQISLLAAGTVLSSPVALLDMTSTTPSTTVVATTAGKAAALRGKFTSIVISQAGATGVVAPSLVGYRTT